LYVSINPAFGETPATTIASVVKVAVILRSTRGVHRGIDLGWGIMATAAAHINTEPLPATYRAIGKSGISSSHDVSL
jgi:hypothetical protein